MKTSASKDIGYCVLVINTSASLECGMCFMFFEAEVYMCKYTTTYKNNCNIPVFITIKGGSVEIYNANF